MKEKLIIKNFGPLKSVDLDLGKITVLIGEQATGKSTVAKVLSICRYFSYIVNYATDRKKENEYQYNPYFSKGIEYWGLNRYIKTDSYIFYENEDYIFEYKFMDTHRTKIKSKSTKFKELLNEVQQLRDNEKDNAEISNIEIFNAEGWYPNELFFRLNVKKVMDNPLFVPAERGFQSLAFGRESLLSDAVLDALSKINRIVKRYRGNVSIEPLGLTFKNENELSVIKKDTEDSFYLLHEGASGYQSTIPVVLAIKHYSEIENRKKTFIIEEPELNLFPKVQKKLMEFMVESVNKFDNQFILPTHSPYILTSLSNLMYAYQVGKNNHKVSELIEEKYWINPDDVSAYKLVYDEKGTVSESIFDEELQEINVNDLDKVSVENSELWHSILNVEENG